ncbi:MAG: transposase [Desulfobacterales bacterium]|nr:transposase [Desulfobacterales bacterium]
MEKFKDKYRIPSARLQSWDYGWNGAYFITICTKGGEHYFGEIVDDRMQLSHIGIIADVLWYEVKNHAKNVELDRFVVMPNHMHGILILDNNNYGCDRYDRCDHCEHYNRRDKACLVSTPPSPSPVTSSPKKSIGQQRFQNQGKNTISSIVGSYKSAVTKHAHRLGYEFAWQPRFHDHIIRNQESFNRIIEYINTNPQNWKNDKFYAEGK